MFSATYRGFFLQNHKQRPKRFFNIGANYFMTKKSLGKSRGSKKPLCSHLSGFGTFQITLQVAGLHRASPSATLDKNYLKRSALIATEEYTTVLFKCQYFFEKIYQKSEMTAATSCDPRVIISPAPTTPQKIDAIAFALFISKRDATSAPVHAPVPGRGIATKMKSPQAAYFSIRGRFFSAFL